tara:strand:- start:35 stop:346 length:312 start_codon:yes stop_codon:yes gene_type:complete
MSSKSDLVIVMLMAVVGSVDRLRGMSGHSTAFFVLFAVRSDALPSVSINFASDSLAPATPNHSSWAAVVIEEEFEAGMGATILYAYHQKCPLSHRSAALPDAL